MLAQGQYEIFEILGNDPSPDLDRWQNFRAWSWWDLQDRMSKSLVDIDPEDEKLQEQLMGVEIKKRTTGRNNILLESKEEMAKRGIHSPDHADAAVYAAVDLTSWQNRLPLGTVVAKDRQEIPDMGLFEYIRMPGRPLL